MYVDAVTSSLSFKALPEDYKFVLYFTPQDLQYSGTVLKIFQGLLSSYGDKSGQYLMSLYDFLTFRQKMKKLNMMRYVLLSEKVMAVLKNHFETVKLIEDIKGGAWNDRIPDKILKNNLWDDQKAAVAFHLAHGRSGNWFSVGLGKTIVALYWFGVLRKQGKATRLLILCLNENKSTWQREIAKHTSWKNHTTIVGNGTAQVLRDINRFVENDHTILVCHYEALAGAPKRKREEDVSRETAYDPRTSKIVQRLSALKLGATACDEAHSLQNVGAKRTKCVFSIMAEANPEHAVFLTATPVSESPLNAYAILRLIRPQVLPTRSRFEKHFSNTYLQPVRRKNKQTGGWFSTGKKVPVRNKKRPYKNLDELAELVKIYGIRRTHADVAGMPPTVDQVVHVALSGAQEALYRTIAAETYEDIAAVPSKALNLDLVIVRTLRLRQVLSHPAILGEGGDSCKYLALDNIVIQHMADPRNKLIIWSSFKDACVIMAERYKAYGAVPFHGDVPKDQFAKYEAQFMDQDVPRILVATPDKAGTGKNLQRARMDVWVDKPVRLLHYEQGRGRIERRDAIGTSVHVSITAPQTIDAWVEEMLTLKATVKRKLLDEGRTDVGDVTISKERLLHYIGSPVETQKCPV